MLPVAARLRHREDFRAVLRRGRRVSTAHLTLHYLAPADPAAGSAPRAGFVISRKVGPAVARNRLRRRLRHLVRERLDALPPAARLVVRALPGSAAVRSATLAAELDSSMPSLTS